MQATTPLTPRHTPGAMGGGLPTAAGVLADQAARVWAQSSSGALAGNTLTLSSVLFEDF